MIAQSVPGLCMFFFTFCETVVLCITLNNISILLYIFKRNHTRVLSLKPRLH